MKYLKLIKDLPTNEAGEIRELSDWYAYGKVRRYPENWIEDPEWFKEVTELEHKTYEFKQAVGEYYKILIDDLDEKRRTK